MNKEQFRELVESKIVILDGAMGTMLQESGMAVGHRPELLNISHPQQIIDIHTKYLRAGADIIYTNTFGANSYKMADCDYAKAITCGIDCARQAVNACKKGYIAYDMGSIGQLMQPMGTLSFDSAYDIYKEQVLLSRDKVDMYVIETISDLYELKAGVLAIKENCDKPIMVTMSFDECGRTFMGCSIEVLVATMSGLGVDAIGMNCSVGPAQAKTLVEKFVKCCRLPIICKPNAGLPTVVNGVTTYDIDSNQFSSLMREFVQMGVAIVGGCCGTTEQYISQLQNSVGKMQRVVNNVEYCGCVTSGSKLVDFSQPKIVIEKINFEDEIIKAISNSDFDYFESQAIEQMEDGAEVIDINIGTTNIDGANIMKIAVETVQAICDIPLQIHSCDPNAIESGLRYAIGKCVVDFINAEDENLHKILEIVKKYGACIVGLKLNKEDMPKTSEKRIQLNRKIIDNALHYGIDRQNIIITCLTTTADVEQGQIIYTLEKF